MANKYDYLDEYDDYLDGRTDRQIKTGVSLAGIQRDETYYEAHAAGMIKRSNNQSWKNNHTAAQVARGARTRGVANGKYKGKYVATHVETGEVLIIEGSTGLRDHPKGPFNRGRVTECIQTPGSTHKGYTWRREPLEKS